MTDEDVVRVWLEGLNDPGLAPTLAVSHEGIKIGNLSEFVIQGPYTGHQGVRGWFDDAFDVVAERQVVAEEVVDLGDGALVSVQTVRGTSTHTGLPFDLRWAARWAVRDGKVQRVQGYATKTQALQDS